jgi:hypothetical protein
VTACAERVDAPLIDADSASIQTGLAQVLAATVEHFSAVPQWRIWHAGAVEDLPRDALREI